MLSNYIHGHVLLDEWNNMSAFHVSTIVPMTLSLCNFNPKLINTRDTNNMSLVIQGEQFLIQFSFSLIK